MCKYSHDDPQSLKDSLYYAILSDCVQLWTGWLTELDGWMSTSRTSTTNTPLISYFMTACFLHPFPLLSSLFPPALSHPLLPQVKRATFPQYYFIGDEDLLEILGQSANPQVLQVPSRSSLLASAEWSSVRGTPLSLPLSHKKERCFPLATQLP